MRGGAQPCGPRQRRGAAGTHALTAAKSPDSLQAGCASMAAGTFEHPTSTVLMMRLTWPMLQAAAVAGAAAVPADGRLHRLQARAGGGARARGHGAGLGSGRGAGGVEAGGRGAVGALGLRGGRRSEVVGALSCYGKAHRAVRAVDTGRRVYAGAGCLLSNLSAAVSS